MHVYGLLEASSRTSEAILAIVGLVIAGGIGLLLLALRHKSRQIASARADQKRAEVERDKAKAEVRVGNLSEDEVINEFNSKMGSSASAFPRSDTDGDETGSSGGSSS